MTLFVVFSSIKDVQGRIPGAQRASCYKQALSVKQPPEGLGLLIKSGQFIFKKMAKQIFMFIPHMDSKNVPPGLYHTSPLYGLFHLHHKFIKKLQLDPLPCTICAKQPEAIYQVPTNEIAAIQALVHQTTVTMFHALHHVCIPTIMR